ncbi:MAG TPA: Dabb family protein [Puia sp.]|jgi:hypothetical protein|nr:Dabb family protein [Puia sp.]
MKRRKFLGASAMAAGVLGLAATARGAAGSGGATKLPPVVHHVFFWLKNPESTADRDQLVEGLKTLAGIPIIRELHVGVLASTEKRDVVDTSWQVSELMFFDNVHDQAAYQQHPLHLDFVKNHSHLWAKVVVYDAMNVYSK